MPKSGLFGVVLSVLAAVTLGSDWVEAAGRKPNEIVTSPVSGSSVLVSADATDDVGVAGVLFLVDGQPLGVEDVSPPYSTVWDTTLVANGVHVLAARARDLSGNESVSETVEVLVDNGPPPDTSLPAVTITSPGNGALVSSTIAISADANDDVGVVAAEFFIDDVPIGPEDTAAPWGVSLDTTDVTNGSHALKVRVRDAAGNFATSAVVLVEVDNAAADATGPGVGISAPADGATLAGAVTVAADVSDEAGVVRVQFFLDGAPLAVEVDRVPYTVMWDTAGSADGAHTLWAVAWDEAGNSTTSPSVSVDVDNSTSGEPDEPVTPDDLYFEVTLEPVESAEAIVVRAQSHLPVVTQLELRVDDQPVMTAAGSVLVYTWDTHPLVGFHQIQVTGYDDSMQAVTTAMVYQIEVDPTQSARGGRWKSGSASPAEVAVLLSVGDSDGSDALRIQGGSELDGVRSSNLYIDGELVASERNGKAIDYLWTVGEGPHEVVLAVEDRVGVVAVASLVCP